MAKGIYAGVAEDSLVANGDFSNGLNGWDLTNVNDGYISAIVIDDYLRVEMLKEKANVKILQTNPYSVVVGHVYYCGGYIKVPSDLSLLSSISLNSAAVPITYDGMWHLCSRVVTATSTGSEGLYLFMGNSGANSLAIGEWIEVKDIKLYDLTAMYGAGNEPTKAWCDANLEALETLYKSKNGVARKVKKAYVGVAEDSLVANGDFSNGLNGWAQVNPAYVNYEVEDGKCKLTPKSAYTENRVFLRSTYVSTIPVGHTAYYSGKYTANLTNSGACLNIYFKEATKVGYEFNLYSTATETKFSTLHTITLGDGGGIEITGQLGLGAGDYVLLDYIKVYDLTALYGAGNEPTKEWCDNNLEALKELYKSKNGVARKVKKGYIGVGGVARLFFSGEPELSYYGKAADLSNTTTYLAATTIGDYALFGGGTKGSTIYKTVDAYNSALTKSTCNDMGYTKRYLAATSVGNYALFAGGERTDSGTIANTVDTYTSALAKGTATNLTVGRKYLVATTVGDYALFGGGSSSSSFATVNAYDSSLTRVSATNLSVARTYLAATTVGDYALFAGGYDDDNASSTVDTYTSSLVKGTATDLSVARYDLAATSVGNYALFAGGNTGSNSAIVDTYTSSLVKGTATSLSVARRNLAATSVGNYALFGGGNYSSVVDTYTSTLTKGTAANLSAGRNYLAATSVGNYALFGGGHTNSGPIATVDAYQLVG